MNYLRVATPPLYAKPVMADVTLDPSEWQELEDLWKTAELNDPQWQASVQAIKDGKARFPQNLELKVSISKCAVNAQGQLFRDQRWVPNSEPLRIRLLQAIHDSPINGHPGRELTYQNCHGCQANNTWCQKKHGLLKPLAVPDHVWSDISIDFIEKLPLSQGC
ncbi:hypothetical protein VTO42DRAFT_4567 [Malbranchea cinnamomea]